MSNLFEIYLYQNGYDFLFQTRWRRARERMMLEGNSYVLLESEFNYYMSFQCSPNILCLIKFSKLLREILTTRSQRWKTATSAGEDDLDHPDQDQLRVRSIELGENETHVAGTSALPLLGFNISELEDLRTILGKETSEVIKTTYAQAQRVLIAALNSFNE